MTYLQAAAAAPINAQYVVGAADGTLTAERVVTDTATVTWDLGTAGQAKANVDASIATDAEVAAAITAHEAAGDPHPGYLTSAEGNAAYEALGAVAAHAGAADPHTGYQKESEKSAANGYASLGATGVVPPAELGTGSGGATKFLREDSTWQVPAGGPGGGIPLDDVLAVHVLL